MGNLVGFIFLSGLVLIRASQPKEGDVLPVRNLKPLGTEFAEYFKNVTLNDLGLLDPRLPTQQDLLCLKHLTELTLGLSSGEYWALKMIDAWGFIPSGILTGNQYSLGNFDECLNIEKDSIRGKYCFLETTPSKMIGLDSAAAAFWKLRTATCFPASCSATHMNKFLSQMSQRLLNVSVPSTVMSISDSSCQTSESEPWDGLTIFTIVFLSLMGSIVALCTLYDYFVCKNQSQLPTFVKVFSARVNSRALFRLVETNSNPNVIDCLHGIRCMSLFWVVYCHGHGYTISSAYLNFFHVTRWVESPFASFYVHGYFTVDSFFVIGGLLVALVTLRSMDKSKGKLNVPLMYLHRLIRIVPLLAMSILIYTKLMGLVADGPLFKGGFSGKTVCENGWYRTMLFVNNYFYERCLGHTWYLAADMQLFILSPILLICLYKWGNKAAAGIIVVIALFAGLLFGSMMVNHYSTLLKSTSAEALKLFSSTHYRCTPWLTGFIFGYFLYINQGRKFRLSWVAVWSGWILCLAMMFTSIFVLYPAADWSTPALSTLEEASYYTFTRLGWPLAICWVIFACMQGYGGLANSFLSSPLWQPLSRLSYSVYIWHVFVQEVNKRSVRTNSYYSDYQMMLGFWSDMGITVLLSYALYLIIEAPFAGLDLFIRPQKKPFSDSKENTESQPESVQQTQIIEDRHSKPEELKECSTIESVPSD
ncbi:nose resistant to fluoxetine protein 6-like isoform X1 [Drosophila takahashii]|uniref:nose resistant to fluoxetine protein 6-like isoform X1 n=2 Tax=Drosophila takahashii TaxID=29030 RepID=UPI001CF8935A|nr:nose resistant to fluoxetine protein 6-like [Drosophila takahashii]